MQRHTPVLLHTQSLALGFGVQGLEEGTPLLPRR